MTINLAEIRKFLTALAGVAGTAIAQGLVSGAAAKWLSLAIAATTAVLVYLIPNAPTAAPPAAP